jgi:Uma2 family endonuclease
VEIMSPSTRRQDRFTKRRLYQEMGVEEYWLVDFDAHTIEVWAPDAVFPRIAERALTWHPAGAATALRIELATLFMPV